MFQCQIFFHISYNKNPILHNLNPARYYASGVLRIQYLAEYQYRICPSLVIYGSRYQWRQIYWWSFD